MFSISTKGIYGLFAAFELALNFGAGPLRIERIARAHNIPRHYLEQLLLKLKKGGLVRSRRGAEGGYELARHPSRISVYEVLRCLEGEARLTELRSQSEALNLFLENGSLAVRGLFKASLEQLVDEHRRQGGEPVFMI